MSIQRTSAPVPPTQDRASFEVRLIFKLDPVAQVLVQTSAQHCKGCRFHSLSGLISVLNLSHTEEFYPSVWSNFPCFNICPLTQSFYCNLLISSWPPLLQCFSDLRLHRRQTLFKAYYLSCHVGKNDLAPLCHMFCPLSNYLWLNSHLRFLPLPSKYLILLWEWWRETFYQSLLQ